MKKLLLIIFVLFACNVFAQGAPVDTVDYKAQIAELRSSIDEMQIELNTYKGLAVGLIVGEQDAGDVILGLYLNNKELNTKTSMLSREVDSFLRELKSAEDSQAVMDILVKRGIRKGE